jgi:hypothetical protein
MEFQSDFEPEASKGKTGNKLWVIVGCVGLAAICAFTVLTAVFIIGSRQFVSYGIASDITEYIEYVYRSEADPALKADVLDRLITIREHARNGEHVGFWNWIDYDTSILTYIETTPISEADLEAVQRELDSIEKALADK